MASIAIVSILTTIDTIIERTNKVKVCQDHTKLITNSLTRLQHRLNIISDETYLPEDLLEILKTIDEIITSCTDNENVLKGMNYQDLESTLIRLQYRLAQSECNLTDDCQTRVQILSNALEDQQLYITKSSDETWKQRLDTLEQEMKKNITNEKYSKIIESYLNTCIELYQWISIPGLTSDIVTRMAKNVYQISSKEQIILENKWHTCKFPIKQTFVRFNSDKLMPFERKKLQQLLTKEQTWEQLVLPSEEEFFIRNNRWNIILGDPGSGKTNFVQWLIYYFAETLLKKEYSTNYGLVRIPILISIEDFVEIWKEEPSITLFDYIGKHKWMGKSIINDSSISLHNLSCALQDFIRQGQALIILDGLDHISTLDQRSKIIHIIENFVDTYVQTPEEYSLFDGDPFRSGGNQIIITCRTSSYHQVVLTEKFSCYTIQPMNKISILDFIDYWFSNVHKSIIDILNISLSNQTINSAEKLKKELETTENKGLLEMASNPRLLSYICTICLNQTDGQSLPSQRFLQYESIIKTMLNLWSKKMSTIDNSQVIEILTDITSYIYQSSSSNIIHYDQIKEICVKTIKTSNNYFERQVSQMLNIICDNLGILTLREESSYGFIHIAFQEYFTCLKLLEEDKSIKQKFIVDGFNQEKKIELVNQKLSHHASDKRFRIPIGLALGKMSSSWSQGSFDDLCYTFIHTQNQYDSFLPFNSYILINSIDHFIKYPSNEILFNALDLLIIAAGQHKWSILCPFLFDQITNVLKTFPKEIVTLWINQFLSEYSSKNIETITAFCQFLQGKDHNFENIQWLDEKSCSILQSLLIFDNENNGFAIDRY